MSKHCLPACRLLALPADSPTTAQRQAAYPFGVAAAGAAAAGGGRGTLPNLAGLTMQDTPAQAPPLVGSGGAAAFSAPPAQSSKILAACGGGGAAAASSSHSHQQPPSFAHAQLKPSRVQKKPSVPMPTFDGSKLPTLLHECALFDGITYLIQESASSLAIFQVVNLMLICDQLLRLPNGQTLQVFGSFGVVDSKNVEHRFRVTGFEFIDGKFVKHEGSVEKLRDQKIKNDFMIRVGEQWKLSRIVTRMILHRC